MLIAHDQTVACPIKRKKCISLYFRMSNQSFFYSTYLIFLLAFMYFKHKEKITFFFFFFSQQHSLLYSGHYVSSIVPNTQDKKNK